MDKIKSEMTTTNSKDLNSTTSPLLPILTDDMFVIETPSFVVPYVYEKPSKKSFRQFLDKLQKELEEPTLKEESQKNINEPENDQTPKKKKSVPRRRRQDDDDASWHGESSLDSEDESLTDDDTVIIKDKIDSVEDLKQLTGLTVDKVCSGPLSYFNTPVVNFFMDLGLNLVQEYVQVDLYKHQYRKLSKQRKFGRSTKAIENSIASLSQNLKQSKAINAPYKFKLRKCEFCHFKTESKLVMEHHLETPHMKNNMYKCNFCCYEIRKSSEILHHIETEHKLNGKLEKEPAIHQCSICPFEDSVKAKLVRHQAACTKKFKEEFNLTPPLDWEPPAKIPKISQTAMLPPADAPTKRAEPQARAPLSVSLAAAQAAPQPPPSASSTVTSPHHASKLNLPSGARKLQQTKLSFASARASQFPTRPLTELSPVTALPRLNFSPQPNKTSFVICEICDGFIKDLEQLESHMQRLHSIKIPQYRLLFSRPPICCQKCRDIAENEKKPETRFYTDQGLERHLLGKHGLVSSALREASEKGIDSGRCLRCGKFCQGNLLSHVKRDHNMTLKPTNVSYKCTVCGIMFSNYQQFETHVYSLHNTGKTQASNISKNNQS